VKTIRTLAGALYALAALFLLGCFQAEQVINVKPDGSGTVVMTLKMGKDAIAQMKALGGGDANADPLEQMMKKEEAEQMAAKLGEGAKLDKIEPFKEGEFVGKRATYSFPDINKIRADMNMGPNAGDDKEGKEPITFQYDKASGALVINSPNKKPENKPEDPQEDAQMAAAASMLKDMRITIAVNIVGTIAKTDAENKDGTRITIVDLPVGEALKDVKRFKAIDRAPNWEAASKLIKEIPGAKVESKSKVSVQIK
jgi:hypothetical protein